MQVFTLITYQFNRSLINKSINLFHKKKNKFWPLTSER